MKTDTPETHPIMDQKTPRFDAHCLAFANLPIGERFIHLMGFAKHMEQCHENQVDIVERLALERNAAIEALENYKALSIHTCSQYCQRPLCVANRRIAEMREVIKEAYKALEDCHVALPDGDDTAWNALSKLQPFIKP